VNAGNARLRLFIIHASHHLTNHAANGDGLVAWGYIAELGRRGHRIHAVTDRLDVRGDVPPNLTPVESPRRSRSSMMHYLSYMAKVRALYDCVAATEGVDVVHQMNQVVRGLSLALLGRRVPIVLGTYVGDWKRLRSAPNYRPSSLKERIVAGSKGVLDALQQCQATRLALATPHALSRVPLHFLRKNRIRFLHHGVDTALFYHEAQACDPTPRPQSILFLGSIRYNKGAATLIGAFRIVAAEVAEALLIFIGAGLIGEMRRRLERTYRSTIADHSRGVEPRPKLSPKTAGGRGSLVR
jgi:glycosyltransferase involved in cell wall biosynthesis